MYCPNCGKENEDNQKFCTNCGTRLEQVEEENQSVDTVEEQKQDYSETKSLIDKIKSMPLFLKILIPMAALFFITIGAICTYQFEQDIKPLSVNSTWGVDSSSATLNIKYKLSGKQADIDLVMDEITPEDWQIEYNETYNIDDTTYSLEIKGYENKIKYSSIELLKGKPIVVKFIVPNLSVKDYVKLKELMTSTSFSIGLPNYLTFDKSIRETAKEELEGYNREKQQKAEDETIINNVNSYAFVNVNGEKTPIDFNPRRCKFKAGGICFGQPFLVHGMDYTDCSSNKNELGIATCSESRDIYASTAYVCGGTKNMPTLDELVILANDMYRTNIFNNIIDNPNCSGSNMTCNLHKATRNSNKDYLEYFRTALLSDDTNFANRDEEIERHTTPIFIMSSSLSADRYGYIYGRYYFAGASALAIKYRYGDISIYNRVLHPLALVQPFSICVDRRQSKSVKNKYPLMKRNYTEETEDEVF